MPERNSPVRSRSVFRRVEKIYCLHYTIEKTARSLQKRKKTAPILRTGRKDSGKRAVPGKEKRTPYKCGDRGYRDDQKRVERFDRGGGKT